jgi:hypothetical protein
VKTAASAATSQATITTPKPAVLAQENLTLAVTDPHGTEAEMSFQGGGPLYVSPVTSRPAVGSLQAYVTATLTSPSTAKGTPYAYNLDYAETPDAIPAQQHLAASARNLAAITENYYQDIASAGAWGSDGLFPGQAAALPTVLYAPAALPGTIQYSPGPWLAERLYSGLFTRLGRPGRQYLPGAIPRLAQRGLG